MIILLLILSLLVANPRRPTSQTYTIAGTVSFADNRPAIGATALFENTSIGSMTDSNGKFQIINVPIDCMDLIVRMPGCQTDTLSLSPTYNDTILVDVTLWIDRTCIMSLEQKINEETYIDTVKIFIENWREFEILHTQVWFDRKILPSWELNDSTLVVATPADSDILNLHFFPAGIVQVRKTEDNSAISVRFESEFNTDSSLFNTNQFRLIDITTWGSSTLKNWGLLGVEVIYNDFNNPEVLLIYHEHAVLLDENLNPSIIQFPFPTFHYRTDPDLNYLLIWDIYGQDAIAGDAALISLFSKTSIVFDPTPETDESILHIYSMGSGEMVIHVSPATLEPWEKYYITTSGNIVRLVDNDFRVIDSNGIIQVHSILSNIDLSRCSFTDQFLSQNETAISSLFFNYDQGFIQSISLEGNILNTDTIPRSLLVSYSRRLQAPFDPESAIIWKVDEGGSIYRINCLSGEVRIKSNLLGTHGSHQIRISENHQFAGLINGNNQAFPGYFVAELRNWNTSQLISASLLEEYKAIRGIPILHSVTNKGHFLLQFQNNSQGNRLQNELLLTTTSGAILWRFPTFLNRALIADVIGISPDERVVTFLNGKYLVFTAL